MDEMTLQARNDAMQRIALAGLADENERLQARIDALMLEHCPDEMTPEQIANWERNQKAVPNA